MTKRDERIAEIKDFVKDMKEETNAYYGTRGNDYLNLHKHVEFLITELEKEISRGRKLRDACCGIIKNIVWDDETSEWFFPGDLSPAMLNEAKEKLAEYDQESEK